MTIANYHLVFALSSISTALPFLTSTLFFRNLRADRIAMLWWFFFCIAAAAELILHLLSMQNKQSGWVFHVYTAIEYTLIASILAKWQTNPKLAKMVRLSIPFYFVLFILTKTAGLESFSAKTANYLTRPAAVFLLCLFVFVTLHALWRHTLENIATDYRFWMLFAMALYYSTSLVLFAFTFTSDKGLVIALFKIHAAVNIAHNLLFTIGVFKLRGARGQVFQVDPIS